MQHETLGDGVLIEFVAAEGDEAKWVGSGSATATWNEAVEIINRQYPGTAWQGGVLIQDEAAPKAIYKILTKLEPPVDPMSLPFLRLSIDVGPFAELAGKVFTLAASTGIGVAAWRIAGLWAALHSGRKLKIKVGDIEVEATQMNEEDVLRIFGLLEEKADRKKIREALLDASKRQGGPDPHR